MQRMLGSMRASKSNPSGWDFFPRQRVMTLDGPGEVVGVELLVRNIAKVTVRLDDGDIKDYRSDKLDIIKDNPPEYDAERKRHLVMMRTPGRWPIWPILAMRNYDRDFIKDDNALGVLLDFPHGAAVKFTQSGKTKEFVRARPERERAWYARTVWTVNLMELPDKQTLLRAMMTAELVDWPSIPHETFNDFDEMYDAGWRVD
jgi:hypothetical protein